MDYTEGVSIDSHILRDNGVSGIHDRSSRIESRSSGSWPSAVEQLELHARDFPIVPFGSHLCHDNTGRLLGISYQTCEGASSRYPENKNRMAC